jgi:hypothetical protein
LQAPSNSREDPRCFPHLVWQSLQKAYWRVHAKPVTCQNPLCSPKAPPARVSPAPSQLHKLKHKPQARPTRGRAVPAIWLWRESISLAAYDSFANESSAVQCSVILYHPLKCTNDTMFCSYQVFCCSIAYFDVTCILCLIYFFFLSSVLLLFFVLLRKKGKWSI